MVYVGNAEKIRLKLKVQIEPLGECSRARNSEKAHSFSLIQIKQINSNDCIVLGFICFFDNKDIVRLMNICS